MAGDPSVYLAQRGVATMRFNDWPRLTAIPLNERSGSCQTSRRSRIFGKIHYISRILGKIHGISRIFGKIHYIRSVR
jgi:hypothetical protein